jgi:hypothetical protein
MICRMWNGYLTHANAPQYEKYLTQELFPHLEASIGDRGYLGYQVLRAQHGNEVRITTLVWFTSLAAVRSFAGEDFAKAVLTDKAKSLVSRWDEEATHHEVVDTTARIGSEAPD